MIDPADQARRWRLKAEECRTLAERMQNPSAQDTFLRLAQTYDHLAEKWERGQKAPLG